MFRIVGYTGPDLDIDLPDMEIDNEICDLTWESREIEEDEDDMLEFYGMKDSEDSLEAQMRQNGVSWKDFI